jgi:nudix-type nucleoside diphosphatase (YffH/AdpP family)
MQNSAVTIVDETLLSDNWYILRKITFERTTRNGSAGRQTREVYDRGNGATILLYDDARRKVVLTRQFRLPAYMNGHSGYLIEAAAGLLDDASPEERIRLEAEEETGYRVGAVEPVFEAFMSPGSVTERLHFFMAPYAAADRIHDGGGLAEEGEDIEVLELDYDVAFAMVASGEIADAKTIMLLQQLQLRQPARRRAARGLTILVAGPYRTGTNDDTALLAANVAAMEAVALPLYQAGHFPIVGEWLALPMARLAGSTVVGDTAFDTTFHPHAMRLLERCDAVLRIGGPSPGADAMVTTARDLGLAIFTALDQVPVAT